MPTVTPLGGLPDWLSSSLLIYAGLLGLTALGFKVVPGGFLPTQDRGYAIAFAQLPDASSLDRTQAVVDKISKIARETPGILNTVEFAGFNLFGGNQTNTAAVFLPFKEFSERTTSEQGMPAIVAKMNARVRAEIPEALVAVFPPPPVSGIGNAGGYRLFIQDRGNAGLEELQTQVFAMMMKANQTPGLTNNLTTFRANVPQLWLEVDRVKAKSMNVPLSNIFGTLQTYLGSTYVNDLTLFGRTYRVTAQADSQFRLSPDDIRLLKTRNTAGGIVPLGSVATVQEVSGADKITRYNMFPAADLSGQPAPGASTGEALAAVERLAKEILPTSFTTEWTEIALQQKLAGNSAIYIFPLCVLFVFLLLSALYESWSVAARDHSHRPDVSVQLDRRRLAALDGEQHLYPDRLRRAGRARLQERHPHRRVRETDPGSRRQRSLHRRGRSLPPSIAPDPDDFLRLHFRCPSAGSQQRRRR